MKHPVDESGAHGAPSGRKPVLVALLALALIVAFYLLREHWGHVAGLWLYLLLLACPLMHLFHGHGGHGGHGRRASQDPDRPAGGG